MKKAFTLIILALGISVTVHPTPLVSAAQNDSAISITAPGEGDVIVGHNAEFNGKGPKNTLITIEVTDADTTRPLIEHQKYGHVSGSTTSDTDGDWVFVPQQELVPGKFNVQASYITTGASPQTVKSESVAFTVVDNEGSSGRLSAITKRRIWIAAGVAVALLLTLIAWIVRRHRRKKSNQDGGQNTGSSAGNNGSSVRPVEDQPVPPASDSGTSLFLHTSQGQEFMENESKRMGALDAEAMKIEDELAQAAEQLERTNAEVAQLRQRIADREAPPPHGSPPQPDLASAPELKTDRLHKSKTKPKK